MNDNLKLNYSYLFLEISSGEFERIEKRVGGREPDVIARLVPLHPVDDGRQDLVRLVLQTPIILETKTEQKMFNNFHSDDNKTL